MPDAANVKRACEIHYLPTRKMLEREDNIRRQLEERERLRIEHQRPRKTYAELKAELAEVGIFIGLGMKGPRAMKAEDIRTKYGVTKEQWDAIPNAPRRD